MSSYSHSAFWSAPVGGVKCIDVLDMDSFLDTRNVAFGGQNIWVRQRFYPPVCTHEGSNDLAIPEVTVT